VSGGAFFGKGRFTPDFHWSFWTEIENQRGPLLGLPENPVILRDETGPRIRFGRRLRVRSQLLHPVFNRAFLVTQLPQETIHFTFDTRNLFEPEFVDLTG
jgi:hypothetical protein